MLKDSSDHLQLRAKQRCARPQYYLVVPALAKQDLLDTVLGEVNRQISTKGLYIKVGSASLMPPSWKPSKAAHVYAFWVQGRRKIAR